MSLAALLPKTPKPDNKSGFVLLMIDNFILMPATVHRVQPESASLEQHANLSQTHL